MLKKCNENNFSSVFCGVNVATIRWKESIHDHETILYCK
jgi:hypothetical protein